MLTFKAYAKVNLTLEVLGPREDGYHDIVSVMQTIDMADTVKLEPADEISLECDQPALQSSDNLALVAANALRAVSGGRRGVRIALNKDIPVAAGFGGGSSDAAAVLKGVNELWGLGMSLEELMPVAARIGSDVPFFLHGGTAMALGRGDRIRPLPPADLRWMVVLMPPIALDDKTASLYRALDRSNYTPGALTHKLEARIRGGGDVPPQFLYNAFDAVAFDAFPGLEQYWSTFYSLGAREIHLAGSGPAMYAPVSRKEVGTAIHLMLQHRHGWDARLVSTQQVSRDRRA